MLSSDIRRSFIEYFVSHGHTHIPPASLIPDAHLGLLFTNSGMCQFSDHFLNGTVPSHYDRACNVQRCVRASGKHNDFMQVGKDHWHFSLFEMLGNWSFQSYSKKEAIEFAWDLLVNQWGLDKERLHVTVFSGDEKLAVPFDEETYRVWSKIVKPSHIHLCGADHNFWTMGEEGPCGPCTEIHYDIHPTTPPNRITSFETDFSAGWFVELWNLVFIQYRHNQGDVWNLPNDAMYVDTGMGLERIATILQKKTSPYQTDLFQPIVEQISTLTDKQFFDHWQRDTDIAIRIVADAARMAFFAVNDGIKPEAKGCGSVLRTVIRRAVAAAWKHLNVYDPLLYKLAPVVYDTMKPEKDMVSFTELVTTIKDEEIKFHRILAIALKHVDSLLLRKNGVLDGESVFDLHTTHGVPPDVVEVIAPASAGFDKAFVTYKELMKEHCVKSGRKKSQPVFQKSVS